MSVLRKQDQNVRRLVKHHPLLKDAQEIGRGAFCIVFESKRKTRVLKLTADKYHYKYLTQGPKSVYRPLVYQDYKKIGQTKDGLDIYLLEVERLYPIEADKFNNKKLAMQIIEAQEHLGKLPQTSRQLVAVPEDMLVFMRQLNKFQKDVGCHYDLHESNFMQRKNGRLIFSDPFYDKYASDNYGSGY